LIDIPALLVHFLKNSFLLSLRGPTSCLVHGETVDRLFVPLGTFAVVGWSGQQHCGMVFLAGRDFLHDFDLLL
jgi:hypothetical protein